MQPLVRAAIAVGVLMVVSGLATEHVLRRDDRPRAATGRDAAPARMPCGPRELPEGDACVPIPRVAPTSAASSAAAAGPDEDDPAGARIPRRPDRPADLRALRLPVEDPTILASPGAPVLASDADHSVLRLGAPRGTPAVAVPLLGQEGAVEVIAIEPLPGRGLVVAALATTREGTREERWLLLWGSLEGAGPGLARGSRLVDGAVVGFAGAALSPGEPHVRFEARRLRAEVDPTLPLSRLAGDAESIPVDARNILPPR